MLIFCLLNNLLYYTDYNEEGFYKYQHQENLKTELTELKTELNKYNKENNQEKTMYITIKTKIDILTLKQKFNQNSWQYKNINNYLYDIIYQINYYEIIEKNEIQLKKYRLNYQIILDKLNKDDYKYFLKINITNTINEQYILQEEYTKNKNIKEIKNQLELNKINLQVLNYRLKNNINENNTYLNETLKNYQKSYEKVKYYESLGKNITYQEKIDYQNSISQLNISKYIMKKQLNINKQNNLNYQLRTIVEDYEIFIVMLILIVSTTIICEEFKIGTIKLLLIKPYSRCKILLSKYFTTIIIMVITIILLIILQLLIGGTFFSFDSLKIPVVIYDFNKSTIVEYSVFTYMIIRIIHIIPLFLSLITISFILSILFTNTIISLTIPLLIYMFTPTIINITNYYKIEPFKYLLNLNWNLQNYLFGKLPEIEYINPKFSFIIIFIYLTILTIFTFIIFKKKNIKNI